eukprot:ANDGO_03762.mRNA.2 putative proline iminopeptidase
MNMSATNLKPLYAPFEPFSSGYIKVSDLHTVYYELSGNPNGKPVVFLHGGPGGSVSGSVKYRQFFNPEKWLVVGFDQRGCGKSTPFAELRENDTWALVSDIEKIREHLKIEKWTVFGGSWGSTLALAYAETHVSRVLGLILRGIFLLRKKEIDWFYQEGASFLFPEFWEQYLSPIPVKERGDLVVAYHKRLTGANEAEKLECCRQWAIWEGRTCTLVTDPSNEEKYGGDLFSLAVCLFLLYPSIPLQPSYILSH